jgi:endonuclease V-like protein UPF0215 family
MKGARLIEGVIQTWVWVDDPDLTGKLIETISSSPHHKQLRFLLTKGVTMAGFGILDLNRLEAELGIPCIAVTLRPTEMGSVRETLLTKFSDGTARWATIEALGPPIQLQQNQTTFVQFSRSLTAAEAMEVLKITRKWGRLPEPLRIAHMIARSFPADLLETDSSLAIDKVVERKWNTKYNSSS